jgi:hypothetical protein
VNDAAFCMNMRHTILHHLSTLDRPCMCKKVFCADDCGKRYTPEPNSVCHNHPHILGQCWPRRFSFRLRCWPLAEEVFI